MYRHGRRGWASGAQMFMKGALKLVCLQEDQEHIAHPGERAANLNHLDRFFVRCQEQGYRPGTLCRYRSSCQYVLIWLHGLGQAT